MAMDGRKEATPFCFEQRDVCGHVCAVLASRQPAEPRGQSFKVGRKVFVYESQRSDVSGGNAGAVASNQ